jgi:cytochrome c biogenesis protein CcmG, thiol:disulfide interchange protein DsbE
VSKSRRQRPRPRQPGQAGAGPPAQPPVRPAGPRSNVAPRARGGPSTPGLILGLGAILIVAAAIAAVALTPAAQPPASAAAPGSPAQTGSSAQTGTSAPSGGSRPAVIATLPPFEATANDPAVGSPIPEVDSKSFDGTPVSIKADGRPKLIVFLAHWCPHCQREVPVVQSWLDAKGMPAGVELVSVVTAIDPNRPNYPPDAWLAREHWQVPVIVDADGQIASSYGLTAFPYWVAVNANGTVAERLTGELTPEQLDALVALVGSP